MKKTITLLVLLIITSYLIYSVILIKKYDKFDDCDIYEADEDTELNFYIYVPKDSSKKPYMILKTNLMTSSGFINYKKIIILSNNNEKAEIDIDSENEAEIKKTPTRFGANGMIIHGSTLYYERSKIQLNDNMIKYFNDFFIKSKTADVRFVGLDNKDVNIDIFEMNWIKAIFKKWKEINIE